MNQIREKVLWWAADRRLRSDQPVIIAVAGSIAKTSTKEAVGAVVRAAFPGQVRVSYGNLNTYLGVPLAILGFKVDFYRHDLGAVGWLWLLKKAFWRSLLYRLPHYLVLELGTDRPGDLPALLNHIKPMIGLLTVIGPEHMMNFDSLDAVAAEEGSLLRALPAKGVAIINKNDRFSAALRPKISARVIEVDCAVEDIAEQFARATGKYLNLPSEKIDAALAARVLPSGRMNSKRIGNHLVIDDTYNASPLAMEAALNLLKKLPHRKVAVLGSMLEMGAKEKKMHHEVGVQARATADFVISVGDLAKDYRADVHFTDSAAAAEGIYQYLQDDDSILVKGSHGIHMEKIIQALENTNGTH